MPITVRHDVADLPMPKVDPQKYNTGMGMAQQERKYAMDAEMLNQRQDYAMDAMQMRNAQENQGPPSLGQQGMMIDQAIRAGSFDPDTVKALRENVRKTNEAFRSRNINNEQRQQTMRNLQEERDLLWGMGYPSRKVESVAGKGNKEPMTGRQYYQNNPKEFNERVEQQRKIRIDAGQTNFTNTDLYNDVINDWEARQKFFNESPGSQPQGQPPAMGAQPTPASATAPPPAMGASPLSAPATAPLTYAPQSMESGRWGGQAFGTDPILAMPASPPIPGVATGALLPATPMSQRSSQPQPMPAQQQPMYPMEAIASSRVDPGYMAPQDSGFASARTFTSADGRSMVGSILGINPPSSNGGFSTVQIQRESDGKVFDVPLNNLSQQDQQYALSGGNRNTMYDMQNPQRSAGTDFMDPNNPVRQEMSAADQSIVNPQKQTLGSEYKGRYGLGGADYGINPATGNRVTASVRPGGTMLEYDPPGPTKEQVAKDNAAKQKQRDFNERVRKSQGRGTNNQTLVAGDAAPQGGQMQPSAPQDTPALTQLLATMTPSQRRDYSKWLMEEPDRYAMRNQIAQQQLNQTAAAARGNGQLPKYPGLQQRIQERNQQQGRVPMQGNAGQQSPPVEMGIDQAIAIARNPNASEEDQKKAVDVMKKNGITTVDQAKEAVGRVPSPPVTDQGVVPSPNDPRYQDRRGGTSPYPYSETYKGGAVSPPTGKDPSKAESTVQQDAASKPNEVNVRKWTSADGKKTFDGSLVGLSYDDVNGRRVAVFNSTDGRVFKIPIENLSEDDQSRLLAASAIEKATDRQSSDFSKYGVKIGIGEKYSAPETSGKTRPSKGKGRGTSTDPSSKWPDEVIRSIPARTARDSKRTS